MNLSEEIRRRRKQRGITQVQLAESCHVSRTTITNIEKENADPSLTVLQLIASALDCEVSLVPKQAEPTWRPMETGTIKDGLVTLVLDGHRVIVNFHNLRIMVSFDPDTRICKAVNP